MAGMIGGCHTGSRLVASAFGNQILQCVADEYLKLATFAPCNLA